MKRALVLLAACALPSCVVPCPPPAAPPPCPACAPCESAATAPPVVTATPPSQPPLVVAGEPAPEPTPQAVVVPAHSDWTQFQGDAARWGRSSAPALRRPVIRWKARVGIQGYLNTPLVSGPTVFVPSSGNTHNASDPRDGVHALDLATGKPRWHARFQSDANGAALAGDRIVATSDDGNVYGLDASRGAVVWKRRGQGKVYSHPVVVEDIVVVGDAQGFVRAYAWADGTERWTVQMNGAIRGGLASDGTHLYAVSQGGEVAAFTKTGQIRWRKNVDRPAFSGGKTDPIEGFAAPVVTGNTVVVPFARDTYYDNPAFVALDVRTGAVQWRAKDRSKEQWGNVRSTPALVDGLLVYAEPYSGDVAAIEASSGRVRYRQPVGECYFPQYASAASAGDLVYVPRFDGRLYAVEAATGRVVWQMYLGEASRAGVVSPSQRAGTSCSWEVNSGSPLYSPVAVAADGTVIVGNGGGTVFAIGQ